MLVRAAVGVGLPLDDVGDPLEHAGLPDDLRPELGDVALLGGRDHHGGAAGDRLGQRELADVVHERGVLEVDELALGHAHLAADRHGQPADAARVAGLGVAADLGDLGQRPDRLQVRRWIRRSGGTRTA